MPLPDDAKIVSVDDHLIEHADVWRSRLSAKHRGEGPHVVDDGRREFWIYEDRAEVFAAGLGVAAGRQREDWSMGGVNRSDIIPGCYDPAARLADMDTDGVWAQVCFPTFPRFAGVRFLDGKDKNLALACVRAYNDFVLEEWCAADPSRFVPLAIVPLWDVGAVVAEIERVAARGARSISFPENPEPLGLPSWHTGHWDPMFAALQDAELPLSVHVATSQQRAPVSSDAIGMVDGISAAGISVVAFTAMALAADLTFSHVFHSFPGLKVVLSEGGVGWIPYLLERLDWTWERQRHWTGINADVRPSELFRSHIYGCFIDDEVGIRERHTIGVANLTVESDYPHSDTSFPNTRRRLAEVLADVPDDEARAIAETNARSLYRF